MPVKDPLINDDVAVFGLLMVILAVLLRSAAGSNPFFRRVYKVLPPLLLAYFIPATLNSFNIISGEKSQVYHIASRYLLPAALVLFTLGVDYRELWKLRKQAGAMFLAGSIGIILGGPLTILIMKSFAPSVVGGEGADAVWRGMATVAGSWIGGTANMTALYEVFKPSPSLYSSMVALDVVIANIWVAALLYGAGVSKKIDRLLNADTTTVDKLRQKFESYQSQLLHVPSLSDMMMILGVGFGVIGVGYLAAGKLVPWIEQHAPGLERFSLTSPFFWVVILATLIGSLLSFTPLRKLEGAGASRMGNIFLYVLIAAIGMQMDVFAIFRNPGVLIIGLIWLCFHIAMLLIVARIARIPFFFLAVGSEANLGGAAQASIVAAAFHPALAPVGVLLAIFGYVLGNYGGYICGVLMSMVA